MAKIFSWKISDNLYGYIVPVNGNSYLTSTRIDSKDTPQLYNYIVETVTAFTETRARIGFNAMNAELNAKYGTEVDESLFQWDSTVGTKAIILTGKDGQNGRGGSGGSGSGGGGGTIPDEIFKEFEEYIDRQLNAAQERIKKINEEVKKYLEEATAKDVQEAIAELEKTKQRLEEIEVSAQESLDNAKDALDEARKLFSGTGGTITAEAIQNVMDKTKVVGDWLDVNKENISGMTFDYDEATKILAGGYTASTVGAFSTLATGINTVSGTVGSVQEDVDYCKGEIIKTGSYVDTISGTVTEVQRGMSAMEGKIKDMVTYSDLSGKVTTEVIREMDAREGKIIDKALAKSSSAVTEVRRELNAFSGYIEDKIFVEMSGNMTTMYDTMNGIKGTAEKALTRADEAMSSAVTLRDDWNVASGMVRSVADLVAETDAEGKIIYKYRKGDEQADTDPRVYRNDETGEFYEDKALTKKVADKTRVYVNYNTKMGSYIKQTSSSVTISVINDKTKMGPAIGMCIADDGTGIIDIISDKVNIDAEVVIKQLETKYGNIGGTVMHNGEIYSIKKNDGTSSSATSENSTFIINGKDGSIKANNAIIKGGTIGGINISDNSISSSNGKFSLDKDGKIKATNAEISGSITANSLTLSSGKSIEKSLEETIQKSKEYTDSKVIDGSKFISKEGDKVGENFTISSDGLIEANNAVIYGKVYASEGEFFGNVTANRFILNKTTGTNGDMNTAWFVFEDVDTTAVGKQLCPVLYWRNENGTYKLNFKDIAIASTGHTDPVQVYFNEVSGEVLTTKELFLKSDNKYYLKSSSDSATYTGTLYYEYVEYADELYGVCLNKQYVSKTNTETTQTDSIPLLINTPFKTFEELTFTDGVRTSTNKYILVIDNEISGSINNTMRPLGNRFTYDGYVNLPKYTIFVKDTSSMAKVSGTQLKQANPDYQAYDMGPSMLFASENLYCDSDNPLIEESVNYNVFRVKNFTQAVNSYTKDELDAFKFIINEYYG